MHFKPKSLKLLHCSVENDESNQFQTDYYLKYSITNFKHDKSKTEVPYKI